MIIKVSSDDLFALLDVLGTMRDAGDVFLEDESMRDYLGKAIKSLARYAGSDTLLARDTIGESILEYYHRFSDWPTLEE